MNANYLLVALALVALQTAAQVIPAPACYDCPVAVNLTDPEVLQYVHYVIEAIQKTNNCTSLENIGNHGCAYILEWILRGTFEVIPSPHIRYELIVERLERQPDLISAQYYECSGFVPIPLMGDIVFVGMLSCKDSEFCPGCWEDLNPDHPEVIKYAEDALKEIQKSANCNNCAYEIQDISSVKLQYQNGENLYYVLDVQSRRRTGHVVRSRKEKCEVFVHVDTSRTTVNVNVIKCTA